MNCARVRASRWRRGQLLLLVLVSATPATAAWGQMDPQAAPPGTSGQLPGQPRGPAIEVTWADILRLVDRHPRLAAGTLQVDAAQRGVDAAGAVPNPTLEGSLGLGRPRPEGGFELELPRLDDTARTEWGLALTLPLGWLAQRGPQVEAARAEVEIAQAEARVLRRDVLLQLRTLFWTLVAEQARVAALEALEGQTSELVQAVRRRAAQGEVRPVEATRVEIELERVSGELQSARSVLGARRAELALWLGVPAGGAPVAVADLDTLPAPLQLDSALALARANHPALAVARARTRSLETEVGKEKAARAPSLAVTGFAASELDRTAYGLGLAVDLPVWNWNSGRIAAAEARLAAGRKEGEAARLEVEASILECQAACQRSVQTATRFRDNVVPRSESVASMMERSYLLGEASLLEVIDARRTLLDSRTQYLSALGQAQIDCSRLGSLVGEENR